MESLIRKRKIEREREREEASDDQVRGDLMSTLFCAKFSHPKNHREMQEPLTSQI